MDGFSGYNQIDILPVDQHKITFIFPWGTFTYQKLPFGLQNVGATFQWAMSYAFHDIKHIVESYLDDLSRSLVSSTRPHWSPTSHLSLMSVLQHPFEPPQMHLRCRIGETPRIRSLQIWD
jgi:hypothetical protein